VTGYATLLAVAALLAGLMLGLGCSGDSGTGVLSGTSGADGDLDSFNTTKGGPEVDGVDAVGSSGDEDTSDTDTSDTDTGDTDTGDPGTGDTDTGDPGTGDPGTGDTGTGDTGTGDPDTSDTGGDPNCDCDDGRPCTDDLCDDFGGCMFEVQDGTCLIANVCYAPGDAHPDNKCVSCNPDESVTEWTLAADGAPCGADDSCVTDGVCSAGQCDFGVVGCDDGNACTDDACLPASGCVSVPNFDPCEDGNPCTQQDFCDLGACVPSLIPLVCKDGEQCTVDACGPDGCVFVPKSGKCSDGTECSVDDYCQKGVCNSGAPLDCNDGNVCTVDKCDPYLGCLYELVDSTCCVSGVSLCDDQDPCTSDVCNEEKAECEYTPNTAACDDGQPCTGPDKCAALTCSGPPLNCDDANDCTTDLCSDALGGCQHTFDDGGCDDLNACTTADACVGGTCVGKPLGCSDGEACTLDSCHPIDGCQYQQLSGACNDGNACTVDTVCTPSGCQGKPKSCDDDNGCTNDSCHPTTGCQHQAIGGPCDDGLSCSVGDTCVGGDCIGDESDCGCLPDFSDTVGKLTALQFGPDGQPGSGLDVDGDPGTCAPAGKCSAGIDNQLSLFGSFANQPLQDAFADGGIILLLEHVDFKDTGQLYTLNFLPGKKVKGDSCNVQTAVCDYLVDGKDAYDETTCVPIISFDNAKIKNGKDLTAGGQGYVFPIFIPLEGITLEVIVSNAQIVGEVTLDGGQITSFSGLLAGAVPKQTLLDGIDAIDEKDLPQKGQIKQIIEILIQNDIDGDGDGSLDSASIGLVLEGIAGHIVGLK